MRDQFPGYYRPTDDGFSRLWQHALFVLDANVLLNLYRADSPAADQLLDSLQSLRDRLWVPHQAALEYQENRLAVLRDRAKMAKEFESELNRTRGTLGNAVRDLRRHPALDHAHISALINSAFDDVDAYIAGRRVSEPTMFQEDVTGADPIFDKVTELLSGRVGEKYSQSELATIHDEGKRRYTLRIPPGYEDVKKGDSRQFGDLVLWKQILSRVAGSNCSVILVTDDDKDDWWRTFQGKRIGPRPELVEEYKAACGGDFYMYSSARFAEEARRYLGEDFSDQAVREIERAQLRGHQSPERAVTDADKSSGFTGPEVCTIVGVTTRQLDYWRRTELVEPSLLVDESSKKRRYSYGDLIEIKVIRRMLDGGASLETARRAIGYLREHFAEGDDAANLAVADNKIVLARSGAEIVDLLREINGPVSVISLIGVVEEVDEAVAQTIERRDPTFQPKESGM